MKRFLGFALGLLLGLSVLLAGATMEAHVQAVVEDLNHEGITPGCKHDEIVVNDTCYKESYIQELVTKDQDLPENSSNGTFDGQNDENSPSFYPCKENQVLTGEGLCWPKEATFDIEWTKWRKADTNYDCSEPSVYIVYHSINPFKPKPQIRHKNIRFQDSDGDTLVLQGRFELKPDPCKGQEEKQSDHGN